MLGRQFSDTIEPQPNQPSDVNIPAEYGEFSMPEPYTVPTIEKPMVRYKGLPAEVKLARMKAEAKTESARMEHAKDLGSIHAIQQAMKDQDDYEKVVQERVVGFRQKLDEQYERPQLGMGDLLATGLAGLLGGDRGFNQAATGAYDRTNEDAMRSYKHRQENAQSDYELSLQELDKVRAAKQSLRSQMIDSLQTGDKAEMDRITNSLKHADELEAIYVKTSAEAEAKAKDQEFEKEKIILKDGLDTAMEQLKQAGALAKEAADHTNAVELEKVKGQLDEAIKKLDIAGAKERAQIIANSGKALKDSQIALNNAREYRVLNPIVKTGTFGGDAPTGTMTKAQINSRKARLKIIREVDGPRLRKEIAKMEGVVKPLESIYGKLPDGEILKKKKAALAKLQAEYGRITDELASSANPFRLPSIGKMEGDIGLEYNPGKKPVQEPKKPKPKYTTTLE